MRGFKNFLMQGELVVVAVGLVVALAFNTLISAFTTAIIDPLLSRLQGPQALGLGIQLGQPGDAATFLNIGAFMSAIVYFVVFMAVIYFAIVVPYRAVQARRGITVFGPAAIVKSCPECLSSGLPEKATRCMYCGAAQPAST